MTTSLWRSCTGWLNPSNVLLPVFKGGSPTLATSLLDMLSCILSTTSLMHAGSLWELIQPSNPAANYLRKRKKRKQLSFLLGWRQNWFNKKFYKLQSQHETGTAESKDGEDKEEEDLSPIADVSSL